MKKILLPLITLLFMNCGSEDAVKDYTESNEQEIQAYISAQGLNAEKSATGLYYVINEPGTGNSPTASSDVTVAYKGYFTDGAVFDQSGAEGISFNLNQVISGWTEGITYFNEGGSGILLIPSRLGYGNNGRGSIPGGAVLIFDINLIAVN